MNETVHPNEKLLKFEPSQIMAGLSILIGEQLGYSGLSRTTFAMRYNDNAVIKIENTNEGVFQNVIEWRAWCFISQDEKLSQYFAPCYEISRCGTVLIQARTQPIPDDLELVEMPDFVGDFKKMNWGMIEDRPVLHDYGILNPTRGRKVKIIKQNLLY
jgi:hypothetical protein